MNILTGAPRQSDTSPLEPDPAIEAAVNPDYQPTEQVEEAVDDEA